jgi:hypothetical protein
MSLYRVTDNTGFLFPPDAKNTTKQIVVHILTAIANCLCSDDVYSPVVHTYIFAEPYLSEQTENDADHKG